MSPNCHPATPTATATPTEVCNVSHSHHRHVARSVPPLVKGPHLRAHAAMRHGPWTAAACLTLTSWCQLLGCLQACAAAPSTRTTSAGTLRMMSSVPMGKRSAYLHRAHAGARHNMSGGLQPGQQAAAAKQKAATCKRSGQRLPSSGPRP